MRPLLASLILLAPLAVAAEEVVGSGRIVEETRPLTGAVNEIDSSGLYTLRVTIGSPARITLRGDDNILPRIRTDVAGSTLKLGMGDKGTYRLKQSPEVTVVVPSLKAYRGEGAGKTVLAGLNGDRFELRYGGAGLLTASGQVKSLSVRAEGAGMMNLSALKSADADVRLEGLGAVQVHASESLDARVEGIGTLTYYGQPKKLKKDVSGIGAVMAGD